MVPPYVGLHVYDTYENELSKGHNDRLFSKGIFDKIEQLVPEIVKRPEWGEANAAFYALERDAETAIRSLLQQRCTSRTEKTKLSLGRHALRSLQKYLIFLRFRNRDTYARLLKLANTGYLFSTSGWGSPRALHERAQLEGDEDSPFLDWIQLLKSFTCFLSGDYEAHKSIAFICDCIHRRYENMLDIEVCVGVSPEPDEYILSASCFGVVEEDGVGNLNDTDYYFFPVSPHCTIYLLIDAPSEVDAEEREEHPHPFHKDAVVPSTLDHDIEDSVDIYQRNALLLQTLPQYLIFVSSRSMIRTLTYYSERRWIPENIDYSKLLRGCREELVTHTLLVKSSIDIIDLTDEVTMVGEHPVCYGSFADVWKGLWTDQTGKGTVKKQVALKVLRANLVGYAQERLFSRLKKEVMAWHRLNHPHVARLHGIMQLPNTLAMVSPWCENGTIVKYLRETNPNANRYQLLYEIASGVVYLHGCLPKVVHGDLKGCNILMDADGKAIITDFGLSKVREVSDALELPSSCLTGSARWMAPEILLPEVEDDRKPAITTQSDVYAFASVCLEILTDQLPYANRKNDVRVIGEVMAGGKPTCGVRFLNQDPKAHELWELMDQCWSRTPRDRPSMKTMCECLDRVRFKWS
ncbi:kinase-like protein [Fomitiporia mediterranea MF3/22]|uniref:kinase-like protein n=1 Tax=Fomitiporia mediterranea (strain MF3/22) TaxID=694068 RepID=UPI00044082D4|nr:kinase-like protein [Fomitiporia mediterranea MF3/22]EJD06363.1 kinase-like protein [Fomitiporia mediterranea MF3/22]